MIFLKKTDEGAVIYPYSEAELRHEASGQYLLPASLAGEDLSALGVWAVDEVPPPETSAGQVAENLTGAAGVSETAPGKWQQVWAIRNRTSAELTAAKAALMNDIRAIRWEKETGGCTALGMSLRTDETSRTKIAGAIALFDKDQSLESIDFEASDGVWVTLDETAMEAIGIAVGRFVQQCFSYSKTLMDTATSAASFADLAAIDIHAGWPE